MASNNIRSEIYDYFITSMTTRWYRAFLCRLPPNSTVLDIGIGTASALIANKDVILNRNLKIKGVDYDKSYVEAAEGNIRVAGLSKHIEVVCASIHDFTPSSPSEKYDAIYFSGSFMIIPDKVKALERCKPWLNTEGKVGKFFFTQSFQHKNVVGNLVNSIVKPALKMFLTIDFGEVTYRDDFAKTLEQANMTIETFDVMFQATMRDEVLVIARA